MKIELIPVLELGYTSDTIPEPESYPPQDHSGEWENYHKLCFDEAGFADEFIPYLSGEALYRPELITDNNLRTIVEDIADIYLNGEEEDFDDEENDSLPPEDEASDDEGETEDEEEFEGEDTTELAEFYGGFVLKVDGVNVFYPQCCGSLTDLEFWKDLAHGKEAQYLGHPEPGITFNEDSVTLTFAPGEEDEPFIPYTKFASITLPLAELHSAVEEAVTRLEAFAERIDTMAKELNIEIPDFGKTLVFGPQD